MSAYVSVRALCLVVTSSLVTLNAQATELFKEYRSAHHLGMGDAGVANPTGHDAIFYNPAGIAQGKKLLNEISVLSPTVVISDNSRKLVKEIQSGNINAGGEDTGSIVDSAKEFQGKQQHVGLQNFTGVVFRRAALGVLTTSSVDALYTSIPSAFSANAFVRNGVYATAARGFFNDSLYLGVNYKYIIKSEIGQSIKALDLLNEEKRKQLTTLEQCKGVFTCGTGHGVDLGLIWTNDKADSRPRIGVTVHNVGDTKFYKYKSDGTAPNSELQTIDVGLGLEPKARNSGINLYLDVRDVANRQKQNIFRRLHLGGEISFQGVAGVMGGLSQGYPTFGAFVNVKFVRFDGGVYTEDTGDFFMHRKDKRFFGRMIVGWAK